MASNTWDFFINPDWEKSEQLGVPFWMVDGRKVYEKPTMPTRWLTNRYCVKPGDTIADAMRTINSTDAQSSLLGFSYYLGVDQVFQVAVEKAAREAFGRRYIGIDDKRIFVWEGQYHKPNQVQLQMRMGIKYKGLWNFIQDAGEHNRVFKEFIDIVRTEVQRYYPDATVTMCHDGYYRDGKHWSVTFIPSIICTARNESEELVSI